MTNATKAAEAGTTEKFFCKDCGSRHINCPMLHDELWGKISDAREDLLCWSCAEYRIGRDVHSEDLKDCGWTSDFRRVAYRVNAGRWFADGRPGFTPSALPAETPDQGEALRTARAELIEANAELIYLRLYGKDGALWSANDSKEVWRVKARAVPASPALAAIERALAARDAATPAPDERRSVAEIRAEIERWLKLKVQAEHFYNPLAYSQSVEHIAALEWTLAPPKPPAVKETT